MSNQSLPSDIVAVESGGIGYLFYVNAGNQLAYLRELKEKKQGNTEFAVCTILNEKGKPIDVHPEVKQIAAISWVSYGKREIRVYYCAAAQPNHNIAPRLSEYCLTNIGEDVYASDAPWRAGSLQAGNKFQPRSGSSMSATLKTDKNLQPVGLRIYTSKEGDVNRHNSATISVFKYDFTDEEPTWGDGDIITSNVQYF